MKMDVLELLWSYNDPETFPTLNNLILFHFIYWKSYIFISIPVKLIQFLLLAVTGKTSPVYFDFYYQTNVVSLFNQTVYYRENVHT